MTATPKLGALVGQRVRELREQYGMSQAGLADALGVEGSKWTRSAIAMLENDGVRGDRLGDLAALCAVFNLDLLGLVFAPGLRPTGQVVVKAMGVVEAEWLLSALEGNLAPFEYDTGNPLGPQIGVDSPESARQLAKQANMSIEAMYEFAAVLSARLGAPRDRGPAGLRDWLAGISAGMPRSTISAKRGHAARLIVWASGQTPEALDKWITQRTSEE
jgi:transcriptional regulator with XRE-family HTH domain